MNFLYPQFLYALFTLIIPIIIHLFNFQRHKKVYFSNVSFLKEVKQSTQAKSNLKHLLILCSRMLAITALVLAFAQPFFPVGNTLQEKPLGSSSLFIDNSFSSENTNTEGLIADIQRELSFQLINELPKHINHQLLSNNFTSSQQHLFPVTELYKNLENLQISAKRQPLSDIIKRQSTAFKNQPYTSYIISDFQKSQFNFSAIENDSLVNYTLIPVLPISTENLSLDSVWFMDPVHRINQEDEIHVRIKNTGNEDQTDIQISLKIDAIQKAFVNVNVAAHTQLDTLIRFNTPTTGWHSGRISIQDFPIVYDNEHYFTYHIREHIEVLEINADGKPSKIEKAFALEPYFQFSNSRFDQLDLNALKNKDLIIVNELHDYSTGLIATLKQYVNDGGHLTIIPAPFDNQASLNMLLSQLNIQKLGNLQIDSMRIKTINLDASLYQKVFTSKNENLNLPTVYKSWNAPTNSTGITQLSTANNQAILSEWNHTKGKVYLFSIALDETFSNFTLHSLFLPTFYQMGFKSGVNAYSSLKIGQNEIIPLPHTRNINELIFHVKNEQLLIDLIPEVIPTSNGISIGLHNGIQKAGNYNVMQNDSVVAMIALNYDRSESDLDFYTTDEIQHQIDSLGLTNFQVLDTDMETFATEFKQKEKGIELWRWFILLTLLFLAIEIVLIRYFKPSVL